MGMSKELKEITKQEWHELGFYYDKDNDKKLWVIIGDKKGILIFANMIEEYTNHPNNDKISEHDHYGPYAYLEIMTWDKPGMDEHAIHGTLADLKRLAYIIKNELEKYQPNSTFYIGTNYASDCKYKLAIEVKENNFNPARADTQLWE